MSTNSKNCRTLRGDRRTLRGSRRMVARARLPISSRSKAYPKKVFQEALKGTALEHPMHKIAKLAPGETRNRPKYCPGGEKMRPRGAKTGPRQGQERPRSTRKARKNIFLYFFRFFLSSCAPEERPRAPQEGPKSAQERPREPQEGPKSVPRGPQERPKRLPRGSQERSKRDIEKTIVFSWKPLGREITA